MVPKGSEYELRWSTTKSVPVTPAMSEAVGAKVLEARRGGALYCLHEGERVKIAGHAGLYLEGRLLVG